jgi:putative ABC transport system permease protein
MFFAVNLKIILRQLARRKAFSFINLVGLIAGTTVCLFVAQFVWFEYSFERFNKNIDRTYRVNLHNTSNGVFEGISPRTVSGLAYAMRQSLTGIESVGRISSKVSAIISNPGAQIKNLENEIVLADPSVFDILDISLRVGDPLKVLKTNQSILISESAALKYFGTTDVAGKLLEIGFPGATVEMKSFSIDGTFADVPLNSHLHFDFVLSPPDEQAWNANWAWSNVFTYVRIATNTEPGDLGAGLAKIVSEHHQDRTGDKYLLEPLRDIRLYALDGSGRATIVNFFIGLACVVLMLAWFNYISLSTAGFLETMKAVGLRKLLGASRQQLILQLLTESLIVNAISILCAILLFVATWPVVASYFQIPLSTLILEIPSTYLFLCIVLMAAVFISGLYPSLFLSSFRPLQAIKGKVSEFSDRSFLRKILVVTQLAVSLTLITAILTIEKQINFIQEQNLGITLENTLIIDSPLLTDPTAVDRYEVFKNEILRLPLVQGVTYASSFPGGEIDWHRADITLNEENAPYRYSSRIVSIGAEFFDVFNLTILTGRNFKTDLESDRKTMLINEEASKMFGFKRIADALGKVVFVGSRRFEIIGVIKNYHFRSLQYHLQPILYIPGYPRNPAYAIRISGDDIHNTISVIENKWKEAYPNNVFSYHFLDEKFNRQYLADKQIESVAAVLTVLAVIISFLGLFGLSLYTASRRIREIGIRRVFGASVTEIVFLLSNAYAKLVAFGCVIGIPLAYQLTNAWLQKYAYQTPLDISLFVLPIVILVVLTVITISIKTVGAANANPIDILRHE